MFKCIWRPKKFEEHKLRFIEQKVCNISYMHPNQKIKFNDRYVKIDRPVSMAAHFESMNDLIIENDNDNDNDNDNNNDNNNDNDNVNVNANGNDGVTDKSFVNKPVAVGYNVVKNPGYNNVYLEKDGYIKCFAEDCVQWFFNEMLEIEGYIKN